MNQSFGSDQRIRNRQTFQLLFKKGIFKKGRLLNVWVLDDAPPSAGKPKLGIIVSRKTASRAVSRNLWKRRIREAFRRQTRLRTGVNLLLQARQQEKVPTYQALSEEMNQLLAKAGAFTS